ncbi:MAG TPA: hypothetical protein V6D46_01220 [Coleofasciculaceae cyanobacterium]
MRSNRFSARSFPVVAPAIVGDRRAGDLGERSSTIGVLFIAGGRSG